MKIDHDKDNILEAFGLDLDEMPDYAPIIATHITSGSKMSILITKLIAAIKKDTVGKDCDPPTDAEILLGLNMFILGQSFANLESKLERLSGGGNLGSILGKLLNPDKGSASVPDIPGGLLDALTGLKDSFEKKINKDKKINTDDSDDVIDFHNS